MADLPDGALEACGLSNVELSKLTKLHEARVKIYQAKLIYGKLDPKLLDEGSPDTIEGLRSPKDSIFAFKTGKSKPGGKHWGDIVDAEPIADCVITKIISVLTQGNFKDLNPVNTLTFEMK